jgi:CheY-like chemotaxis protein
MNMTPSLRRILVLDDDYNRQKTFKQKLIGFDVVQVTTSKSAIAHLENEKFEYVFLDHDLGGEVYVASGANTGYEVAQWLAAHVDRQPANIVIHSFNPVGRKNMMALLPGAIECPGAWDKITVS